MRQNSRFSSPAGFNEYCYEDSYAQDFVLSSISNYFYKCGFDKLKIPTLEHQKFFSSEYVGTHPWPNFHPKSLFAVTARDYNKAYEDVDSMEGKYFLIPEGTTSLCRWVSSKIEACDSRFKNGKPVKLFYTSNCFRNELVSTLSDTKLREFVQIGAEYLGIGSIKADIEIIQLLINSLVKIGLESESIIVRVNDVRLFRFLAEKSKLNVNKQNAVKNHLDNIASFRAQNKKKLLSTELARIDKYLHEINISSRLIKKWKILYNGYLSSEDIKNKLKGFPQEALADLYLLTKYFENLGMKVVIDTSVTRSQEYYNKLTFQADVHIGKGIVSEIAGGGRYDYFVNKIMGKSLVKPILFATGFAFSLERIMKILKTNSLLGNRNILNTLYNNDFDYVVFSQDLMNASKVAETLRVLDLRVDNYIASDRIEKAKEYANSLEAELLTVG
ncbi:ATP phosphoribosyltransferase regulatory subunit [Candidatus Dojkabacteria bacterium]|nr:ATP phosphoribosyltransferase regulatory subunit [Candidatus Dojkabacteria bacterium]